ncbi:uncharacterized protein LOC18437766 isoform X1 [Amborella trichopoda]|uniref:uncharacterized protein LOC18437766 isoform X1 n=1 Tax=Amborella trichopoda TaxID=13333 RepID=UPI0009C0E5E2|nr:uncharacterized protein LOC18437766 isoform X1 [Amborella trichopoda]|eukprot:XP_020524954.1 uncharacterized protein LOC18437766 isoform X1 [Amborella trichopoda]
MMELSPEIDNYIKETIAYSLGLPVSSETLAIKLQGSETARKRLQSVVFSLQDLLREKDDKIEHAKAEATMNAQAVRRQIEENQKLVADCMELSNQCARLENECALYYRDREQLVDYSDERIKEAESRAQGAEDQARKLSDQINQLRKLTDDKNRMSSELEFLRRRVHELEGQNRGQGQLERRGENLGCSRFPRLEVENEELKSHIQATSSDNSFEGLLSLEDQILHSVILSVIAKDKEGAGSVVEESATKAHTFLEEYMGEDQHWELFQQWERLKPSTRHVLALVAEVESLRRDKDHLRTNLHKAEEEVSKFYEENKLLDEENKKLLRHSNRERRHASHDGSHLSPHSAKSKRSPSPKVSQSPEKPSDPNSLDTLRQPLSPLQYNPPASKTPIR